MLDDTADTGLSLNCKKYPGADWLARFKVNFVTSLLLWRRRGTTTAHGDEVADLAATCIGPGDNVRSRFGCFGGDGSREFHCGVSHFCADGKMRKERVLLQSRLNSGLNIQGPSLAAWELGLGGLHGRRGASFRQYETGAHEQNDGKFAEVFSHFAFSFRQAGGVALNGFDDTAKSELSLQKKNY